MKNLIFTLLIIPFGRVHALSQDITGKTKPMEFYSVDDFGSVAKIDVHCHIDTERPAFMEEAIKDNFRIITINTDAPGNLPIQEQERCALYQVKAFPNKVAYLATFSMAGWDDADWAEKTIAKLESSIKNGAVGIKIWKNIGMVEKNREGAFIMIDDPKFDPVFNYLEKKGIPVCGHLGEPRNCWLPIEEMTVNGDRSYFREHPQYHMYLHPEYPSYEDQIRARDNLLRKHPGLPFMGAHLGSLEWNVDELAKRLEEFPNMTVDMAARIGHLQKQAQTNRQKVRDFLILYQDRIIYGTDKFDEGSNDPAELTEELRRVWSNDWKFLTTDEIMTSPDLDGEFRGLQLPREVVEKIYYRNAVKLFPVLH